MKNSTSDVPSSLYIKYIDTSVHSMSLTLFSLIFLGAVFFWPALFIYSLIPLFLANFVECPPGEERTLNMVNIFVAGYVMLSFGKLDLWR